MLVKLDSQNKLTLPDSIIHQLQKPEFFSINFDDNKIILTPVGSNNQAEKVREKLKNLHIIEEDIDDAIQWARTVNN